MKILPNLARLLAVVAMIAAPAALLAFTPLAPVATIVFVGVVPGFFASLYDRRIAVGAVLATGALMALIELAKPWPAAATALMIAVGLTIGWCATKGWHPIATLACGWPATLLIGPPLHLPADEWSSSGPGQVITPAALTLLGGSWAILVCTRVLRGLPRSVPAPVDRDVAVAYGLALAVLLGATTHVAATWFPGTTAGWLLLTVLVVVRPALAETKTRMVARSLGTIAGGIATALLAHLVPVHAVLVTVGSIALLSTLVLQVVDVDYTVYTFVLTTAIILLGSPDGHVVPLDVQRILFTVGGASSVAVLVITAELCLGTYRRGKKKSDGVPDA